MSGNPSQAGDKTAAPAKSSAADYVTMIVGGQLFGIPVLEVHDVFVPSKLAHVPMAPPEVAGVLNLRGRIVTAIDLRLRLGYEPREPGAQPMAVVIEYQGEPYSLLVDGVGEVLSLEDSAFERNPSNLDPKLRDTSEGIFRLDEKLMVVIQLDRVIQLLTGAMAA
ncbi:MAG TPA: chemotaxis protein CheW [Alphaproteobacteria bacterium]|nr:chemotaxis protein CheW [Alphaproteobacteria bacterium]